MRRSTILLPVLAAAILTTGCATFDTGVVATVGSSEITDADFDPLLDSFLERGDLFGTAGPTNGRIDADDARLLLRVDIRQQIFRDFLERNDIDATAARDEFIATNLAGSELEALPPEFKDLVVDADLSFQGQLLTQVPAASAEDLQTMYEQEPASVGMLCLRHVLVDTEAEAEDVLDELATGRDFAEVAEERSTDPTVEGSGGALATPDNACIPFRTMQQNFDPAFLAGALATSPNGPSEPVQSSFGWHIILNRPWDEVADSVLALHVEGDSGGYLLDGDLATTEVDVDPRYGSWDPATGAVLPIG
jgi:hypothetical protein